MINTNTKEEALDLSELAFFLCALLITYIFTDFTHRATLTGRFLDAGSYGFAYACCLTDVMPSICIKRGDLV